MKYLGDKKIITVEELDSKTYLGKPRVRVYLEDENKTSREMPQEIFEAVVTTEKSDLSDLREKFVKPVVEKLIAVLLEAELPKEYMEYCLNTKLPLSVNWSIERAQEKMWGKKLPEITLRDIDKVLKNVQKSSNGVTPE
ncbi:MAG: hypothetical protein GWP09_02065 [Nitrospiraceae bacterium]|nr:hypothetical protein [Nitrospiraceae bacterium]